MAALPSALPDRYLLLNEQQTSGGCLNYLRDSLLCVDDALTPAPNAKQAFRWFDELAQKAPPGSDGLLFTPWLNGERTPVENANLRGGFANLSLTHERRHWVRAVLEGVAYNARWLLGAVDKFIGAEPSSLRIVGGGAKSDIWCEIYANVFGRRVERVRDPYLSTVRGAGILALAASEKASAVELSKRVEVERTFEPDARAHAVYNALYREFLGLYERNEGMFARLNPPPSVVD
jgi:xylulokinase